MFPLGAVLFPGARLPLHVFEERYRVMMADVLAREPRAFGVVLIERGSEVGGGDVRSDVGTTAIVEHVERAADGRYGLVVRGTTRFTVTQWLVDDPYPQAMVASIVDDPNAPRVTTAVDETAVSAVRRLDALLSELGARPLPMSADDSPWGLCDRLPVNPLDRQRLLACDDVAARLALVTELAEALCGDAERLLAGG